MGCLAPTDGEAREAVVGLRIAPESPGGKARFEVAWTLKQPFNQPGAPTVSIAGRSP